MENVTNLACRAAFSRRSVAHINFPVDLQEQKGGERSDRNVPHHATEVLGRRAAVPAEADLRKAAEILNAGKKIAILAGRGASFPNRGRRAASRSISIRCASVCATRSRSA